MTFEFSIANIGALGSYFISLVLYLHEMQKIKRKKRWKKQSGNILYCNDCQNKHYTYTLRSENRIWYYFQRSKQNTMSYWVVILFVISYDMFVFFCCWFIYFIIFAFVFIQCRIPTVNIMECKRRKNPTNNRFLQCFSRIYDRISDFQRIVLFCCL